MAFDTTCPKCKSDEAYGIMGTIYQCLMCGYTEKPKRCEGCNNIIGSVFCRCDE